ncbi:MAG: TylF/MycF/NovP-related O-methyltransferase [Polyangiaceae bacterium]
MSLLKKALLNELNPEVEARLLALAHGVLGNKPIDPREVLDIHASPFMPHVRKVRSEGWTITLRQQLRDGRIIDRPDLRFLSENCHTMMGRKRLDHLHHCLDTVVAEGVPGDVIETGVWRGGGTIFMRGFLSAHGIEDRDVWVADSFQGLPRPTHERDAGWDLSKEKWPSLAVGLDEVKELFHRYELLDERVRFLPGWFKDTLPSAPIRALSVLRLDGDLYESTTDALTALYDRLSPGGFVIIDDYKALEPCERAVEDFRRARGITAPLEAIDQLARFWRKPRDP